MQSFNPITTSSLPVFEKACERIWELSRGMLFGCSFWFMRKYRLFWIRLFASLIKGKNNYASSCSIARDCRIDYPWRVTIGENSSIGARAWIYGIASIRIGNQCCIGDDVRIITGSHDVRSKTFRLEVKPIEIGDKVWLATGAIILPGVSIGEGAVIAAGAVVTKNVEPWTIVGGNPAKAIKQRVLDGE